MSVTVQPCECVHLALQEGEEMDAVTKEAFVEVFARSNLISMEPFAFADAQELARKLFASISAPKALRRTVRDSAARLCYSSVHVDATAHPF